MSDPDPNTRARDALRGEWLPGMCVRIDGRPGRVVRRSADRAWQGLSWEGENGGYLAMFPPPPGTWETLPDLDDPVTELALLVVLRRRVGAPLAQVSPALDDGAFWVCHLNDGSDRSFRGPTEAAALISALEAT